MHDHDISGQFQKNIFISLLFTVSSIILLITYNGIELKKISNSLLILFMVASVVFNMGALFFAFKHYRKIMAIIIINSLGLLSTLILLLMILY
ncbi:hypothetical protein J2787_003343 [Chryseobacterium rhizosphaerae]|jgi:hypothetical protein|uniref:Uncharacterized protein n=1 Tax=Chryseobacterium rhizosphaerae TaxID=395937 RepID=A0AAE3YD34_9FLAO|nr:hypothetical protein [Chryseobacterium rhizosphaerae]MDR6527951.1 hypothetical protein [Chryseobacterium rhizosphaerae]